MVVKKTMIIWRELDDDQSGSVSMAEFLALLDKLNHRGGTSVAGTQLEISEED